MQNRLLSSFLCLLLLVPHSISTCAVASFACADPSCGQSPRLPTLSQLQTAVASNSPSCKHKHCCQDDDDDVSSKPDEYAVSNSPAGNKAPDPSHEHKRHQPECPTNQVVSDRTDPKPQVKTGAVSSFEPVALLPDSAALQTHAVLRIPLMPINSGGPPLYVTHRALLI